MDLPERQNLLQENYKFHCRCSSCSELHLSDLVIDSFCCPRSTCLGVVSELTYYRSKENYVHVSLKESDVCKLALPVRWFFPPNVFNPKFSNWLVWWHQPEILFVQHVSKVDEDTEKVGKLIFRNHVDLKIDPGYCMSCRSQLDLSSAVATSDRAASKINRYIMHYCMWRSWIWCIFHQWIFIHS